MATNLVIADIQHAEPVAYRVDQKFVLFIRSDASREGWQCI